MGIADELRRKAAKIVELGKYAVDSAVSDSLLAVAGKSKDGSLSDNLSNDANKKKQNSVLMEEMQAKLEKLRQDMNSLEQPSMIATCENRIHGFEQFFDEPLKIPSREESVPKKFFIRSRL